MEMSIDLINRHSLLNELNDKFQSIAEINAVVIEQPTVEAIPTPEVRKILRDCANEVTDSVLEIVRKEYIPKSDYETRLKADMVAMLIDLKNKLTDISWNIDMYDSDLDFECCYLNDIDEVIQEKINSLKETKDGLHIR